MVVITAAGLLRQASSLRGEQAATPLRNIFGAHLLIDRADENGMAQLRWAQRLVGRWGHIKTMFWPITTETKGPEPHWREFVAACYKLELVPLIRLAGRRDVSRWVEPQADKPGDYTSIARAIRRVVEGLPRDDRCPLYIEVWNEPNVPGEWGGHANSVEYAQFFVQAARAIHSIGDPRIQVLNGAAALDGVAFTEAMCKAVPEFVHAFDVWASHPYPANRPPEINLHDGTAKTSPELTIDGYLVELNLLRRYGRRNIRVMLTETGYDLGNDLLGRREGLPIVNEANRADYMARAFRDYWPRWSEVVAVFPFVTVGRNWERFEWVHGDSGTNPDGSPTRPRRQYAAVASLAKPGDSSGAISGKVTTGPQRVPVPRTKVTCRDHTDETDEAGCFYLARMESGLYELCFERTGFEPVRRIVRVEATVNAVIDVPLRANKTGRLSGEIRDGLTGRPLAGVSLTFRPSAGRTVTTQGNGTFGAIELMPIAYSLTLAKPAYQTVTLPSLAIPAGEVWRLTLPLGPIREPIWPNLLSNPSFEEGDGGGGRDGIALRYEPATRGHCFLAEDIVRSGQRSQAIEADGSPTTIRQITPYNSVRTGERYAAATWIRTLGSKGEGATISLDFTEDDGRIIQRNRASERVRGTSTTWVYLEIGGIAPAGAKRAAINFDVGAGSGMAYFDDVYLGVVPW